MYLWSRYQRNVCRGLNWRIGSDQTHPQQRARRVPPGSKILMGVCQARAGPVSPDFFLQRMVRLPATPVLPEPTLQPNRASVQNASLEVKMGTKTPARRAQFAALVNRAPAVLRRALYVQLERTLWLARKHAATLVAQTPWLQTMTLTHSSTTAAARTTAPASTSRTVAP